MAIRTSAIFYRRGVPDSYKSFAFVSQANNTVVVPISRYLKGYQFYNRNAAVATSGFRTLPWRN
jgi:hypothetical protein